MKYRVKKMGTPSMKALDKTGSNEAMYKQEGKGVHIRGKTLELSPKQDNKSFREKMP